mmetsp:Transcript_18402/g.38520  ORF Transcript_18402/g.38520 Transcript_18402/m.38520 type:complete len:120 (-) Transcript_18402:368-727(-)
MALVTKGGLLASTRQLRSPSSPGEWPIVGAQSEWVAKSKLTGKDTSRTAAQLPTWILTSSPPKLPRRRASKQWFTPADQYRNQREHPKAFGYIHLIPNLDRGPTIIHHPRRPANTQLFP